MNLALVPAAGRSSRLGRPKPLLSIAGRPLIDRLLESLRLGGIDRTIVIVAPGEDRLLDLCRTRGIPATVNQDVAQGMLSSILSGLRHAGRDLAGATSLTVCPIDFPRLRAATVADLLAAFSRSSRSIVIPELDGRRGHPLVMAPGLAPAVERLDPEVGLRGLLASNAYEAFPVSDPGVLRDLDTWRDYAALGIGC